MCKLKVVQIRFCKNTIQIKRMYEIFHCTNQNELIKLILMIEIDTYM